jgi:hypothetical protein
MTGPPKSAATNVARWLRSKASETETGPRGIFGAIGANCNEINESTFPRADITAMKVRVLDLFPPDNTIVSDTVSTLFKVATNKK